MNKVLVSIVALAMLGAAVPTVDSQEGGRVPTPLPLSTETNTFHIVSMRDISSSADFNCPGVLKEWGVAVPGNVALYAINNVDDPCQVAKSEAAPDRHAVSMGNTAASWHISVVPPMAAGTPLVEGEKIVAKFTLAVLPHNVFVDVSAGAVQPKVTLTSGGKVLGTWDEAEEVSVESIQGPEMGAFYVSFEASFDAPATLEAGLVNLTVTVDNDAAGGELRRVVTRLGFAISEANRGSITFPFAKEIADFGSGDDDGNETGNETSPDNGTDEQVPSDNETGNETVPDNMTGPSATNTTAPSNNTTGEVPDEQGFLPGFELAAVLGAAMVALAFVARERRRPPVTGSR